MMVRSLELEPCGALRGLAGSVGHSRFQLIGAGCKRGNGNADSYRNGGLAGRELDLRGAAVPGLLAGVGFQNAQSDRRSVPALGRIDFEIAESLLGFAEPAGSRGDQLNSVDAQRSAVVEQRRGRSRLAGR